MKARMVATLALLGLSAIATPATAQLSQQAPSAPAGAVVPGAAQPDEALTTFLGLKVQAVRLIRDPANKGFRLIYKITETEETPRLVTLSPPKPRLVDDMGNVYEQVNVTGLQPCHQWNDTKASDCAYYYKKNFTRLQPGLGNTVVASFAPVEELVIADTLPFASSATLTARVTMLAEGANYKQAQFNDFSIPGIALPK